MVRQDEFPFTLGGVGNQQEYKGFDLVVLFRKHGGAASYVINPATKGCVWSKKYSYEDKGTMFMEAQRAVDGHLEDKEKWKKISRKDAKKKNKMSARMAANKAFETSMAIAGFKGEMYDELVNLFASELETELTKFFNITQEEEVS